MGPPPAKKALSLPATKAHVVFTGVEDSQEFLAIDIWHDSSNIEAVYSDPDFQAAFGSLFDAPPAIGVYASTDWHQW